ncbi:hypothetical protein NP233_g801 [Leucocoprinus birnbaumii]|uniref:ATP-dependent DNA helicase PIF1 n=1 Tax=Leucocoprinus birnbaumii TaxID=56174 RepID=A0AAD5W3A8_9AGAR|nr:hypothetical protein NP233_g801 [Leucocoprinus birnbaumii]
MPKAAAMKYYAVAVGRDAPNIYTSWDECSKKVSRYPKALHRSFKTKEEAERWLESKADITALYAPENLRSIARGTQSSPIPIGSDDGHQQEETPSTKQTVRSPSVDVSPPEPKVTLSPEQSKVFAKVKEGGNVFFTGSAGTGKSVLLREIIKLKRERHSFDAIAITASTGIAAINIGGVTLHSWAGIKLGDEPVEKFVKKVLYQKTLRPLLDRWRKVKTLIIDEISMVDASLFDYLEAIARALRGDDEPFGGIQLVLCGDFCQLPPVSGKDKKGQVVPARFAFEAKSWSSCIGLPMMLKKVFRQKDQTFANMLNEMRYGKMQESTVRIFKTLDRKVTYTDGIEPTELYPTRREVAGANSWRLERLTGEPQTYEAQDHRGVDHRGQTISYEKMIDLLDKLVAPKSLELKVGAQVMLIKNLRQGVLVNGSIGQVVDFSTPREAIESGTKIAEVESDKLHNQNSQNQNGKPNINPVTEEIFKHDWKWPVVKFTNGERLVITPVDFTINNGDGETVMARRLQLPLILAWALSVHKSQGQTLERVRVDLKRTFEKGQAYVALSRATNMDHLQVLNFAKEKYDPLSKCWNLTLTDMHRVMAHPMVLAWYGEHVRTAEQDFDIDEEEISAFNESHW